MRLSRPAWLAGKTPRRDSSPPRRPSGLGLALGLCAVLSLWSGACADEDEEPTPDIPCDIRDTYCRRAIFRLTAQVRAQRGAKLPPSRIITRQQFADETRTQLAAAMSSHDAQVFEESLRLVKFLPTASSLVEAMADANVAGVAAYYDPNDATITIIDDAATNLSSGSLTLSHEFTHSLQDQREGFSRLSTPSDSSDGQMALSALIEGEATILSDVAMRRAVGLPYLRADVLSYLDRLSNLLLDDVSESDAPFNEAQLVLPYPVGGRPIAEAYVTKGITGVQGFYTALPPTLTSWVEFDKNPHLPVALTCSAPDGPAGYVAVGVDRLGFTGLIALFTKLGLTGRAAFDAARSWTNDSYAVFGAMGSELAAAVAWRIRLSDEATTTSLETQLRASTLGLSVSRVGPELVLSAATKPEVLSAWTTRDACSTQKSRSEPKSLLPALDRYPQLRHALFPR